MGDHKYNIGVMNIDSIAPPDAGLDTQAEPSYHGHDTFIPYVLNQATAELNADFQQVLRAEGMTLLHWRVLAFLMETDGLGVSSLGRYTGVDQATLSRALTVMEKSGYIARVPNPDDNRMVAINLLPAGQEQFRHVLPLAWDIYLRAVNQLSMDEQNMLLHLLNRIRENMEQSRGKAPIPLK